jgi:ABC-type glycerol-3-phosphate transport system substrate-binding protein
MRKQKQMCMAWLALLGCVAMLTSCGGQTNSADENDSADQGTTAAAESDTQVETEEETEYDRLKELGEYTGEKETFKILDANDYPALHVNYSSGELTGDALNDALYNREQAMEERYGVKIEYTAGGSVADGMNLIRNAVAAGDTPYDLCISALMSGGIGSAALEGLFADMKESSSLSLTAPWWSKLVYENFLLNDKLLFSTGDFASTVYQQPSAMILNSDLLEDNGITTDFYQTVRDGKWTLDLVNSTFVPLNNDLNGDGVMDVENDYFGLIYQKNDLGCNALLIGAGASIVTIEDGKLTLALNNEKTVNLVEKLHSLTCDIQYTEQNDIYNKAFVENRAVAMIHLISTAQRDALCDMESDYMVMPMPKADEAQESYRSLLNPWSAAYVAIPMNADVESSGFLAEAMAYYAYENIRPEIYEKILKAKTLRDAGSSEMLDIVFDTICLDFGTIHDFGGVQSVCTSAVYYGTPFVSALEACTSAAESELEDYMENWQ